MSFIAQTSSANEWKIIVNAISVLVEEASFEATPEGIQFRGMDPSHVAMIDLNWPNASFEKYECEKPFKLTVRVEELSKLIKRAASKNRITISSIDNEYLNIKLENGYKREFKIRLIESSYTPSPVPKLALNSKFVAKISNKINYEADTSILGLSSAGCYMTRPVSLANPSTAIDIRVGASVRSTSTIKFLYRLSGGEETRRLADIPWTYFNTDGSPDTSITPSVGDTVLDDDFKEYKFSASSLPEFTSFQIKCVMNGLVSSYPPRLKDLRAIALAV